MSGKKFISIFLVIIVVSAIGLVLWIKQGYDSRPAAHVLGDTTNESCAAATVVMNRYIELDHAGKTKTGTPDADVDVLMDDAIQKTEKAQDIPSDINLTRDSVVAGCREAAPEQVEVVVSHSVYGVLSVNFEKDEVEKVVKNEPKQMQSRVTLINRASGWKVLFETVYSPHIGVEAARAQAR